MTRASYGVDEGLDRLIHVVSRTDGADTVLQGYTVDAEPETATYGARAVGVASVTANSHLFQVMAGASLRVGIKSIRLTQSTAATTLAKTPVYIYRLSTAGTGGSVATPNVRDPADAAAGATAMALPTVKGTETTLVAVRRTLVHTTLATVGVNDLIFDFSHLRSKALWIAAGTSNGIAVKNLTADATNTYDIEVELVETDVT